jgi:hypothetical protein
MLPADLTTPPLLTGLVYETTPAGRLPVAGASVEADDSIGLVIATTMTDANGRYQLCNLPALRTFDVYAWKDGYGLTDVPALQTDPLTTIDIEIGRTRQSASRSPRLQNVRRNPN